MEIQKPIIDVCCGGKMFWFDHNNPNVLFVDNRTMDKQIIWKSKDGKQVREFEVKPDILADFQNLPFEDSSFYHVVFDPPHLTRAGDTSWIGKKYGRLPKEWKKLLSNGFNECYRILKPYGTLVFKWNEENIKLSEILVLFDQQPMYGCKSGKYGKTHWLVFVKV